MMPSFSSPTWITTLLTVVVSSLVTLALLLPFSLGSPKSKASHSRKIIPSPRDTQLPFLSRGQASALPYPPDILPGARDVDSPYGVMRVYEWGPEEGRKVVMVHGDTTPAPLLGPIAKALVERGCRVLLLGEWIEWEEVAGCENVACTPSSMNCSRLWLVNPLDLSNTSHHRTPFDLHFLLPSISYTNLTDLKSNFLTIL